MWYLITKNYLRVIYLIQNSWAFRITSENKYLQLVFSAYTPQIERAHDHRKDQPASLICTLICTVLWRIMHSSTATCFSLGGCISVLLIEDKGYGWKPQKQEAGNTALTALQWSPPPPEALTAPVCAAGLCHQREHGDRLSDTARSDAEDRREGGGTGPAFLPSFLPCFPPVSGDAPSSRPQPDGGTAARPSAWGRKGQAGGILIPCTSLQLALAVAGDFWSSHKEVRGLYTQHPCLCAVQWKKPI